MKTDFKVGQKVWDAVEYPNQFGIVISTNSEYSDGYPIEVLFANIREYYDSNGSVAEGKIPTLKPYPYTVEFKEKKVELVVGRYYYFWDDSKAVAIYDRFKQMQGNTYLPDYATFGFDNISETPPFK